MPKKLALFFNGTWSTHHAEKPDKPIARLYHNIMYNPTNSITELYNHCDEKHKYIFDGPGTDIFNTENKSSPFERYVSAIAGGINGSYGENGVHNNLLRALLNIKSHCHDELEIHLFGWSRGAYTTWLLKKALTKLIADKQLKVKKLCIYNIDATPGMLIDRIYLTKVDSSDPKNIEIKSQSYFSDTGNLDIWDKYSPIKSNTPLLSALDDDTKNAKKYIIRGNHEDVGGQSRGIENPDNIKKISGDIVISDIVASAVAEGILFNSAWKQAILSRGLHALQTYDKLSPSIDESRKFLSIDSTLTCFFGNSTSAVKDLHPIRFENSHLKKFKDTATPEKKCNAIQSINRLYDHCLIPRMFKKSQDNFSQTYAMIFTRLDKIIYHYIEKYNTNLNQISFLRHAKADLNIALNKYNEHVANLIDLSQESRQLWSKYCKVYSSLQKSVALFRNFTWIPHIAKLISSIDTVTQQLNRRLNNAINLKICKYQRENKIIMLSTSKLIRSKIDLVQYVVPQSEQLGVPRLVIR